MIVVADTSPLNYLIQIESEWLLPQLYQRILVPDAVIRELSHPDAPPKVRAWQQNLPYWCEVYGLTSPPDPSLAFLDPGEREAIQIALEQRVDLLLIDERKGRLEAKRRRIASTGTLGVLLRGGEFSLINPAQAYQRLLKQTSFRTSATLESQFLDIASRSSNPVAVLHPTQPHEAEIHLPVMVVHCDWSMNEDRRWMASAVLIDGKYIASAPVQVGNLSTLLQDIQREHGSTLIGFDFPIGIPKAYADKIAAQDFLAFLKSLSAQSDFFNVCTDQNQISQSRPFYPNAPGGTARQDLTKALGIKFADLLRICEKSQDKRPEAGVLFWTMGAKQPGKAAIVGWRDVLAPALRAEQIKIWPFHGHLDSLLQTTPIVAAETYPAQYYATILTTLIGRKGDQNVRAEAAPRILAWARDRTNYLHLSPELRNEIQAGFTIGNDDAFDAALGLFGMIEAVQNYTHAAEPAGSVIRNIEGWILGQPIPNAQQRLSLQGNTNVPIQAKI